MRKKELMNIELLEKTDKLEKNMIKEFIKKNQGKFQVCDNFVLQISYDFAYQYTKLLQLN